MTISCDIEKTRNNAKIKGNCHFARKIEEDNFLSIKDRQKILLKKIEIFIGDRENMGCQKFRPQIVDGELFSTEKPQKKSFF